MCPRIVIFAQLSDLAGVCAYLAARPPSLCNQLPALLFVLLLLRSHNSFKTAASLPNRARSRQGHPRFGAPISNPPYNLQRVVGNAGPRRALASCRSGLSALCAPLAFNHMPPPPPKSTQLLLCIASEQMCRWLLAQGGCLSRICRCRMRPADTVFQGVAGAECFIAAGVSGVL